MTESIDDEDPVLISLASEIGNLPPAFTNDANVHLLLPILAQLIQGENVTVKALALRSLVCIIPSITAANHLQSHVISLINEYATKDWFTARAAAGCMIPIIFKASLDSGVSFSDFISSSTHLTSFSRILRHLTTALSLLFSPYSAVLAAMMPQPSAERLLMVSLVLVESFS